MKGLLAIAWVSAMPLMPGSVSADFYSYRDEYGVIHLTDRPPRSANYKQLTRSRSGRWIIKQGSGGAAKPSSIRSSRQSAGKGKRTPGEYRGELRKVARRYSLDHRLLDAVIRVESNYDPHAISRAGAVGLMQLMPETAQDLGVHNRWDPKQNIDGGARLLRRLIDRFGKLELALAAYNAGENAVARHGNQIPPFPETRRYVKKVMKAYRGG